VFEHVQGRLAAEQGIAFAQYNLGGMYRKGRGVPQDNAEAVKWWRLGGIDYTSSQLGR
jgi:TPR repeat protein